MPKEIPMAHIEQAVGFLRKSIPSDTLVSSQFKHEGSLSNSNGWTLASEIWPHKLSAINQTVGIFAKCFTSEAEGYAKESFDALQELSTLHLQIPVLRPIAFIDKTIVLPLGKLLARIRYYEAYTLQEQEIILTVLDKHDLEPLGGMYWIDTVSVNGTPFTVDPFSDDVYTMSQYMDKREANE